MGRVGSPFPQYRSTVLFSIAINLSKIDLIQCSETR
jgi:hypothetical protein